METLIALALDSGSKRKLDYEQLILIVITTTKCFISPAKFNREAILEFK